MSSRYDADCNLMLEAGQTYMAVDADRRLSDPACKRAISEAVPGQSGAQRSMIDQVLAHEFPDRR